jgi:hypothetical protein
MADFTDLIEQQKITNQKQDRVIAILEAGDSPQALKAASADEVQAEYDVLKLGQVFQIAYDKLTGISQVDDKIQEQTARDAQAYNITNELLAKQNDFFERILLLNEKSLGIDSKMLLEDKRKATEDERKKLLEKKGDGSGKADGKDLTGGSFSKTFAGLKALLGGVTLFFGGLLLTVKALQDDLFKGAVGDLFTAIGDVFREIIIPAGEALLPIATAILTYTVKGLTLFFDSVLSVFDFLKDFNEEADLDAEDYKGIAPIGAAIVLSLGKIKPFLVSISAALAPVAKLVDTLTDTLKPLAKLPVIATVTTYFGAAGAKSSAFIKGIGKLFLPFTIVIALIDTVKGFYKGFFGKDLEEGEEPPEGFLESFYAGFTDAIKGLVNSLIGAPLNLLKGVVGYVLGKLGFTGAEEALANFNFTDLLEQIIDGILAPFENIANLIIDALDFAFDKIEAVVGFFTEDDIDKELRQIQKNQQKQQQISNLQDRIDYAQSRLDDPNFSGNREFYEDQIAARQAQIDEIRAATGLTVDGIPARIAELQAVAEAAEGGEKERLLNRIAELENLQTELENQNVIIVNTDNKQTQVNNNKGTVSVGKETTPNDSTFKILQSQFEAIRT